MATPTGIQLIETIHEKLLTSCELTGIWEKKLRDIERKKYDAGQFINELKQQVGQIVHDVLADNSNRHIAVTTDEDVKKATRKKASAKGKAAEKKNKERPSSKESPAKTNQEDASLVGQPCPLCGKGTIIKGKTAYGCSRWREGCRFRRPFTQE